jgi:hypothetical protein
MDPNKPNRSDSKVGGNSTSFHPRRNSKPRKTLPPDVIDLMDNTIPPSLTRHHSGPFDAVTKSAYLPKDKSPLAALQYSTEQVLKATPEISIRDSVNQHVPLQNTAVSAPGQPVPAGLPGEVLMYEEENLIGNVRQWDGIEYDDDDGKATDYYEDGDVIDPEGEAEIAKGGKHRRHKNKGQWVQSLSDGNDYNEYEGELVEIVPRDRDIKVDGMKASASAIKEAEPKKKLGIVDGIKRKLSGRRPKSP